MSEFLLYPNLFLEKFAIFISEFSNSKHITISVIILFLILFFIYNKKVIANFILLNFGLIIFLVWLLKELIKKPRDILALTNESGYAFPSGHVALAVITSILIFYFSKYIKNNFWKVIVKVLAIIWLPSIIFARLYLKVHDIYDVLASILIATFICFILFKSKYFKGKI